MRTSTTRRTRTKVSSTDAPVLLDPFDSTSSAAMSTQQAAWDDISAISSMGASIQGEAPCIHIRISVSLMPAILRRTPHRFRTSYL